MRPNSDGSKPNRRFLVQEVPKESRTPRHRTLMVFVNHTGASLRLLKSEMAPLGFDRDPYSVDYGGDEMIPDDGDIVNITVESEEIKRGRN
jgi:hypothetical protein